MRALVVGGGVTGLTAAYALAKAGADVVIAEGSPRLGGKVRTELRDGFLIEHGPDAFLTLRPAAIDLCREIGLGAEIVPPIGPESVLVWHRDRLVPVPPGAGMGMPTRFRPLLGTRLFTPLEKARAGLEVLVPRTRANDDVSIGAFLRRRYGDAVVDRVAGPFISAIYGADVDELSLDALMPRLRDAERRHGSLIRAGVAARRSARGPSGPMLMTLRGGLGSMVDTMERQLGRTDVRLAARIDRIERGGAQYAAVFADDTRVTADAVIVATPAPVAAALLAHLAPAAVEPLMSITYRSTLSVTLAYAPGAVSAPPAHGFVVPPGELPISACTWSSAKWPGRAPDGASLVRVSIRAGLYSDAPDDELERIARTALARTAGVRADPLFSRVARWRDAMPRYTVGHLDRIARIDAALRALPGVVVAGAAYRGSGIPDCIAQGRAAAAQALATERMAA